MKYIAIILTVGFWLGVGSVAHADVKLPAIFSDHMVLQKQEKVPVWGTATPGESVKVTVAGVSATTQAGTDGSWKVTLNLSAAGEGPH